MKLKTLLFSIILFTWLSVIPTVYAVNEDEVVQMADFPQRLADMLTIPLFAGQLLASLIVICLTLFPVLVFTRGQNPIAAVIVGVGTLSVCIALTWLPVWLFVITLLLIALLFSKKITETF